MRSVQSSLLFLYYVVFSVMSVQYCLCVSRIQCTQCSVSVYTMFSVSVHNVQCQSIGSAQFCSVQCKQCSESIASVLKRVQPIGQSLQHTQSIMLSSMVTVYGVHGLPTIIQCWQCSVQYSVVSGVLSLQRSMSVQCLQHSGCVLFSGSFSVCTLQCLQCSESTL